MALTSEELAARAAYIGSSDIPAILGVSRYRNRKDVWLEKTGRLELTPTSSDAADWGDRLERPLVEYVSDELDSPCEFNRRFTHANGIFSAQCDGWLFELDRPIEAKTRGLFNPRFDSSEWGATDDAVPFDVLAQVQFALLVTDADVSHVVALLGGGVGVRTYTIERHEDLITEIGTRAEVFWDKHVVADAPPDMVAHIDTLKDVRREAGKSVTIDEDYPERWETIDEQYKLLRDTRDELKAEIIDALGDADEGVSPFGRFTYHADTRGRRRFLYRGGTP